MPDLQKLHEAYNSAIAYQIANNDKMNTDQAYEASVRVRDARHDLFIALLDAYASGELVPREKVEEEAERLATLALDIAVREATKAEREKVEEAYVDGRLDGWNACAEGFDADSTLVEKVEELERIIARAVKLIASIAWCFTKHAPTREQEEAYWYGYLSDASDAARNATKEEK